MKFLVLGGSPKGNLSVTLQYIHFLEKKCPQHEFKIFHVAQRIKKIESDPAKFQEIIDAITESDALIWAFPLYILLVHAHYKRFIELLWERKVTAAFADKYAMGISTSIKFFDHTAHNYIHAVSNDLGMRYVGGYSAHMQDLLKAEERRRLGIFFDNFLDMVENRRPVQPRYQPLLQSDFQYQPSPGKARVDTQGHRVLLLHDAREEDHNLRKMVTRFCASFQQPVELVNLYNLRIIASCQGDLHCGYDFKCIYGDSDEYRRFWLDKVEKADVLIWAATLRDRNLSSRWRMFLDRRFMHCHTPRLIGKQIGLIIAGPLSQDGNILQSLEGYFALEQANIAGIVTDENVDSAQLDQLLEDLARRSIEYAKEAYVQPVNFLGVGGRKLFRDEIYGQLRTVFRADYRSYRKMGLLDFPTRKLGLRMLNFLGAIMMNIGPLRRMFTKRMKEGMIMRHQQVLKRM